MSEATTFLTDNSLLGSLFFDEVNKGSFFRKPINKIDDVHGQNRLFCSNLQQIKTLRKQ